MDPQIKDSLPSTSNADGQSTMETTGGLLSEERTVKYKSFVIGKKVENQTGINLIDLDSMTLPLEKQFPVKVLYVKPSHDYKNYQSKPLIKEDISQKKQIENNKENSSLNKVNLDMLNQTPKELPIQKNFLKSNGIGDLQKIQEAKHRPKSATTQQIKKESIKHNKLGPNTSVKPQISFVKKVQTQQRPLSAKVQGEKRDQKTQNPKPANRFEEKIIIPIVSNVEIPFTQNRFQGKFQNLTKDLIKKAQEALMEEKQKAIKLKEDVQLKKEKQKQITEEVKQKNLDHVIKQKEKGAERIDFRKKELEMKDQLRKDENRQDREKQKELRKKRKEDSKKQLGLEIFNENAVQEYRKKIKEQLKDEEEKIQKTQKIVKIVDHLKTQNAKQEKPFLLHVNKDLNEMMKEAKLIDEEEDKKNNIDKKLLLKEQQKKRKQQMLEQQMKQDQEKLRKEENMRMLQENTRKMNDEQARKQDIKHKIQEEREKIQSELEEKQLKEKKYGKKKKAKQAGSSHKEQLDDLRNWIEEQMLREDDNQSINLNFSQDQPQKIVVKIDKKVTKVQTQQRARSSMQNSFVQDMSKEEHTQMIEQSKDLKINKAIKLKYDLPGNNDIPYHEDQKYGIRENRYGIYGDNGYGDLIEIKKRQIQEPIKSRDQSAETKNEIRLSKEGMVQMINKIQEYQKLKDQQLFKDQIEHPERFVSKEQEQRLVMIQHQQDMKAGNQSVPGVINVEKEIQRQKEQQRQIELSATKVIQKWSRGFLARHEIRQLREDKRHEIEEEYGYFEDQVKFNTDYNLQKFLKEKQKMREMNETKLVDSMSIQEKIGDSSQSQSKQQYRGKSAPQPVHNTQVQNFFREKSDKDPLSLIEIFAQRNAPKIVPSVVKSPIIIDNKSNKRNINRKQSSSDIEEDIYTESFEEDEQKSIKTDSIDEDIIEGSKGLSSGSFKVNNGQKQPFNYQQSSSIIDESIQEDYLMSVNGGGRNFKSPNKRDESSIAEESALQQQSVSRSSPHKRNSMKEDSIMEEIYDKEGYDSYSGSLNKIQENLEKQKQTQHLAQVAEFEKKMLDDQSKRKKYVNEMLDEMKRYEQASVSTVVVERMEKIITQSLAQKDKLLIGQRLHELELEKNHKDEINKIREEQIRLLSQLILLGPNGAQGVAVNEEERKVILESIQKIIDKPIVIQHQQLQQPNISKSRKPQITVESSSSRDQEGSDSDYIEESKGLSQKRHDYDDENDSIMESIHRDADDDSIAEDIEEGSQAAMSEDDIKESIHIEGKRQQDKHKDSDKGLQKIRMALGSEDALRKNSKNALKKSKGENDLKNNGIFEKNSFQDFTSNKFKQLLFDKDALNDVMTEFENAIDDKKIAKEEKNKKKLSRQEISPRTFKKRNQEIEKWVSNEKHDLMKKQQNMMQSMSEMGSMIKKLDIDKKAMMEKIGSPRPHKNLMDSQSSVDYNDIEEESDESIRIRQARDQMKKLSTDHNKDDPEAKQIERKRLAARKLIAEKEKAIEEGLKVKLKKIEQQQADQMLDIALNLDIQKEIEKRVNGAIKQIEESSDNYNEYSARSYSQSLGPVSVSEDPKKKKNVKFASPERYSSVHSLDHSSGGGNSSRYKSSQKIDDSIGESIKIEESYNISEHINKVDTSKRSHQSKEKFQDSIKESIPEGSENESNEYSDDFIQSQMSDAKSVQNVLAQSRNKLLEKANTLQEDDIEYSMNFDESIGQSQQISNLNQSQKQAAPAPVNQVDEEPEEQEDDQNELIKSQSSRVKDSFRESYDIQEEEVVSESMGASSKLVSHQEMLDSAIDGLSDDKEILNSVKSVEWMINLENPDTQRSKKQSDEDDGYSDDFEKIEEDYYDQEEKQSVQDESKQEDDLDDLESFPDEIADSMDDYNERVDRITDEFLALLLDEVRVNKDLKLSKELDEDDFKDKFPFNIIEEIKPEPIKILSTPKIEEKKVEPKRETFEDQQRAKFDRESKKLEQQQKEIEQYLELIIQNINQREMITLLEKPIDIDPLKKLANIFSQDNAEESFNQQIDSGPQTILSLDFFIRVEDQFKRYQLGDKVADLTESARQSYLQHENIHHKALFDAFNQALDIERPYKEKGKPAPWSKLTRVLRPQITESDVDKTLKKSKERVLEWCKTNAGTRLAPVPPAPPSNNDYDNQQNQPPLQSEEERVNQAREEKLGVLMMRELVDNENRWIDFEDEDTQVKFDLADMVLEELAGEIAQIMLNMRKY